MRRELLVGRGKGGLLRPMCVSLVALAGFAGCSADPVDGCAWEGEPSEDLTLVSIQEGIAGSVWFWDGNFQPGCVTGVITPVVRTVIAFPQLDETEWVEVTGGFFRVDDIEPVDSVQSDSNGLYQIALPPGDYSLFVREDSLLFGAPQNAWAVSSGVVTLRRIDINYRAVY